MKKEIKKFLRGNTRALLRNYADYIESMVTDEQFSTMEDFVTWLKEEYEVAKKEGATGEGNYL